MRKTIRTRAVSNDVRLRARERRRAAPTVLAWPERVRPSWPTIRCLEEDKVAVSFGLTLNATDRTCAVADMFQCAGFLVEANGYHGITVIGEPCLALAFMSLAEKAGKLSPESARFLGETTHLLVPGRNRDHAQALSTLARTLGAIESVHPPRTTTPRTL